MFEELNYYRKVVLQEQQLLSTTIYISNLDSVELRKSSQYCYRLEHALWAPMTVVSWERSFSNLKIIGDLESAIVTSIASNYIDKILLC